MSADAASTGNHATKNMEIDGAHKINPCEIANSAGREHREIKIDEGVPA